MAFATPNAPSAVRRLARSVLDKLADGVTSSLIRRDIAGSIAERVLSNARLTEDIAYIAALELVLRDASPQYGPSEVFGGISDEFWLWLNLHGPQRSYALRRLVLPMPPDDLQLRVVGAKGDEALRTGFQAYRLFKELYEQHVGPIQKRTRVLDFGCGWGRILRFFTKDVEPAQLWGVDPTHEILAWCETSPWAKFSKTSTEPPLPFADDSFDLIYCFSVFSHLSEEMHTAWVRELSRVLAPGGLLVATTRDRVFIEQCARWRKHYEGAVAPVWLKGAIASFTDTEHTLLNFDNGQYCFSQGGHEWSYWGNTAIPEAYVRRNWTKELSFIDYIADRSRCPQNVIVMKKPEGVARPGAGGQLV